MTSLNPDLLWVPESAPANSDEKAPAYEFLDAVAELDGWCSRHRRIVFDARRLQHAAGRFRGSRGDRPIPVRAPHSGRG